ncbi:integral membrane protein S linking to the trans Golgi network-domain-containing protein [Talaromyces proteolyticus]|uniref:Integral membrane protein S linking to the trans Golgi network-domain-containing protein n=1 Tax=Talaromyces proteolyticus TaxID=1131652 RepID=A0AAD4KQ54_9EURO|nr:integral membrane protein S linking to the trans Golgi network-domain-containing protein [Talaromyces proteolyticus]KAH8697039.1 integral membrane protein S linking to the trans Golgi network-domain-containing protein [Talaromyces proteolyticus]
MPPRRRPPRPGALTELPPLLIVRKILLLQTIYYVCATALVLFTSLVAGTAFSLDLIFSWGSVRGDTTVGWMLGLVWMLNSFICVIFLLLIVSRSKLIPDFALTIHFIHLLIVYFYTRSIPRNLLWWSLQLASAALMTFAGIWICQRRELQPISFGALLGGGGSSADSGGGTRAGENGESATLLNAAEEDLENGFASVSRGRGRGRNRDGGGGEFEMMPIKESDESST